MSEEAHVEGQEVGGRFTLEHRLGTGGFGTVWRARDNVTGAAVALKVLHPHLRDNALAVERFSREAVVLERLDHPNVARALSWGAREDELFLALELIDGVTLKLALTDRALRGEHFTLPEVARFVSELGGALSHAHAMGIVHRDFKPSNIMLVGDGAQRSAKVLDFGIAKVTAPSPGDETTVGRMLGSWLFMAPEQVRGESVDHRSDIFAFGATLFELLTLRSVFARDEQGQPLLVSVAPNLGHGVNSRYNLLRRIVLEPRPRPSDSRPGLSPAIDRVVLRALEFEPQDRFQSVAELVRAFAAALDPAVAATMEVLPPVAAALARAETAVPESLERDTEDEVLPPTEVRTEIARELPATRVDRAPAVADTDVRAAPVEISARFATRAAPRLAAAVLLIVVAALTATIVTVRMREDDPPPRVVTVRPARASEATNPRVVSRPPAEELIAEEPATEDRPEPDPRPRRPRPPAPTEKPPTPEPRYAALQRLLEAARANPGDLARVGELAERLTEEADRLPEGTRKTALKRCAAAGGMSGSVQELASCLRQLEAGDR